MQTSQNNSLPVVVVVGKVVVIVDTVTVPKQVTTIKYYKTIGAKVNFLQKQFVQTAKELY